VQQAQPNYKTLYGKKRSFLGDKNAVKDSSVNVSATRKKQWQKGAKLKSNKGPHSQKSMLVSNIFKGVQLMNKGYWKCPWSIRINPGYKSTAAAVRT